MKSITAQVETIFPLTNSILKIVLTPEKFIDYIAGQYLKIHLNKEELFFSIANAPLGAKQYELHIKHHKENSSHQLLLEEIKEKGKLTISLPYGECHIQNIGQKRPIIFIAAGTGFAPAKAMMEQLLAKNNNQLFELYWTARTKSDLYMESLLKDWEEHVENFKYFSIISNRRGTQLQNKIHTRHQNNFADIKFVISGPFEFVFDVRDWLLQFGANKKNLFSDAFYLQ